MEGGLWTAWGPMGMSVGLGNFSFPSNLRTASSNLELALGCSLPQRLTLSREEKAGRPCCTLVSLGHLLGRQAPALVQHILAAPQPALGPEFTVMGGESPRPLQHGRCYPPGQAPGDLGALRGAGLPGVPGSLQRPGASKLNLQG